MTDSIKGALLTMFGGMCWGVSGCVGQYLFTRQGMDSTWLVPIRLFLAGVILCIYYGVRNWRQLVNPWRSWRNARDLVIYGLAGVSFCQFTYFLTIQLSSGLPQRSGAVFRCSKYSWKVRYISLWRKPAQTSLVTLSTTAM